MYIDIYVTDNIIFNTKSVTLWSYLSVSVDQYSSSWNITKNKTKQRELMYVLLIWNSNGIHVAENRDWLEAKCSYQNPSISRKHSFGLEFSCAEMRLTAVEEHCIQCVLSVMIKVVCQVLDAFVTLKPMVLEYLDCFQDGALRLLFYIDLSVIKSTYVEIPKVQ